MNAYAFYMCVCVYKCMKIYAVFDMAIITVEKVNDALMITSIKGGCVQAMLNPT